MPETSLRQGWHPIAWWSLGTLRVALGLTFLWAFLDKLLGLTYRTPAAGAWVKGGSPTKGYLSSSYGPLEGLFKAMAGNPVVDVLFMAGLAGVGIALTLGVATRLGGLSGAAMVLLMYASHPVPWAPEHGTHPFLDTHIVEAAALLVLAYTPSGLPLGLGGWWERQGLARKVQWLR